MWYHPGALLRHCPRLPRCPMRPLRHLHRMHRQRRFQGHRLHRQLHRRWGPQITIRGRPVLVQRLRPGPLPCWDPHVALLLERPLPRASMIHPRNLHVSLLLVRATAGDDRAAAGRRRLFDHRRLRLVVRATAGGSLVLQGMSCSHRASRLPTNGPPQTPRPGKAPHIPPRSRSLLQSRLWG